MRDKSNVKNTHTDINRIQERQVTIMLLLVSFVFVFIKLSSPFEISYVYFYYYGEGTESPYERENHHFVTSNLHFNDS